LLIEKKIAHFSFQNMYMVLHIGLWLSKKVGNRKYMIEKILKIVNCVVSLRLVKLIDNKIQNRF